MAEGKTSQHAPPPPPPPATTTTTNTSNATTAMSNATISSTPPDEDPLRDEEGLLLEYDVVVCGTGLVQAILASALARAGKRVLHCDGEDSYGELDAVWTLDQLECMNEKYSTAPSNTRPTTATTTTDIDIPLNPKGATSTLQFHSYQTTTHFGITIGTPVQTPYGRGVVKSIPTTDELESSSSSSFSVAVALDQWTLADQSTPVSYFGMSEDGIADTTCLATPLALEEYLGTTHQVYALASIEAQELTLNVQDSRRRRSWALDASPVFVLAAGRAVDGMLASNVAEYLEFQSVHGLMWLELPEDKKLSKNKNRLSKVPCNKADVFGTKLLSPLDKRRLMKFLQLAMDYATQYSAAEAIRQDKEDNNDDDHDATATSNNDNNDDNVNNNENDTAEVHSLNERYLNQGRSLARPQNKAVATDELKTLQNCLQQDDDSDEDATTTISKKRKMTLDDYLKEQHKLSDPLRRLVRYALAMETTVESVSLSQGMGQLRHHLQALGRYGSTAFLVPLYGSGELSQAFCRSAAVFGATYLLRRAALGIQLQTNEEGDKNNDSKFTTQVHGVVIANDTLDEEGQPHQPSSSSSSKTIRCHHVVVPAAALRTQHFSSRSKRTYIVRRISLLKGRLMEGDQRHIIVIPPGSLSKDHSHAIHGITLDESVQVAPAGCTILHLTTTIVVDTEGDDSNTVIASSEDKERRIDTSILDRASHAILEASVASGLPPVDQVLATTYSHEQLSVPDEPLPTGIHICSSMSSSLSATSPPQVLTADAAFDQAERLFRTICPRQPFLGLSEELDATIRERAVERDDYDDERLMLESALGMIDGGESAGPTGATKTTNNEEEAASAQEGSMDPPQPSEVPP